MHYVQILLKYEFGPGLPLLLTTFDHCMFMLTTFEKNVVADPETPSTKDLNMIGRNEREHFKTHG